eukprot:TRINITY_DN5723_c0_g1_i3.p1 TRINITY_DN5723_c0_g1~~TRINITY_DN5723_c0_g1_i3.p1  ORF type:complete len:124 (-),score=33.22 TRINITY_DN5723_c0_g1_i3:170-541(-)
MLESDYITVCEKFASLKKSYESFTIALDQGILEGFSSDQLRAELYQLKRQIAEMESFVREISQRDVRFRDYTILSHHQQATENSDMLWKKRIQAISTLKSSNDAISSELRLGIRELKAISKSS